MLGRIVDVSSNNAHPISWDAVKAAGVSAAIIKATQGTGYTNPFYAQDAADAGAAGLDVLAYHWADFGSVSAELAHFQAVAGDLAKIVDIETSTNVAWTNQFLAGLGTRPYVATYGSASSLQGIYTQLHSQIWVAAYGQAYPGFGEMWQFTSSAAVSGMTSVCDESMWMGSLKQYEDLFGAGPIEYKEEGMTAVVLANGSVKIYAAGSGNSEGHLLEFTRTPGSQTNDVRDITVEIGLTANNGAPFLVQP
jgi:GH25 family lysozyme M1 (1,4-beta-N-acetylmuramidase)